jgi:hypothetical protein
MDAGFGTTMWRLIAVKLRLLEWRMLGGIRRTLKQDCGEAAVASSAWLAKTTPLLAPANRLFNSQEG